MIRVGSFFGKKRTDTNSSTKKPHVFVEPADKLITFSRRFLSRRFLLNLGFGGRLIRKVSCMAIGISMIMFRQDTDLSAADIQRELAAKWPDLPAATELDQQDNTLALRVGSSDIILGKMPGPIPWSDLEGPCATSILWPNAGDEVKRHKIHWIVTVSGEMNPLEVSTRLTQATAAVMSTCPSALGVYWGSATLIIPRAVFIDFAERVLPLGPPLHIWVRFPRRQRFRQVEFWLHHWHGRTRSHGI